MSKDMKHKQTLAERKGGFRSSTSTDPQISEFASLAISDPEKGEDDTAEAAVTFKPSGGTNSSLQMRREKWRRFL